MSNPHKLWIDLFFGDMADGKVVAGIGKIAWTFGECDKAEI